ncbi:MAG: protein translocase subunit SecD [candidate division Zixibacteria bacterium]|nr:protein translocase subunit SecD [candidate division Zixibacteria bacterium]
MKNQTWRFIITAALIVLAFVGFWNTLKLWTLSDEDRVEMEERKPGSVNELERKAMRLGLDLQGGIHVVLRVKKEEIEPSAREDAVERAIQVIRNRVDFTGVTEPIIQKQGDDRIIVDLPGYTDADRAEDIIGQTAQLEFKLMETYENASIILEKIDSVVADIRKAEQEAAGENLDELAATAAEAKVDKPKTGDVSPVPSDSSDDPFADFLGEDTSESFDDLLFDSVEQPFTQYLEPALSNRNNVPWPGYIVPAKDRKLLEQWLARPEVQRVIPSDVQFAFSTRSIVRSAQEVYTLYVLKSKTQFLGKYLERIKLGRGQFQEHTVDFRLSGQAAATFARLTGANVDKPLAIVIDGKVESSPFINSKIRNDGQIQMGSGATLKDAQNMEIVLKAGALPAPVEIIEKNVVGPSLGSDSIRKGLISCLVGLLLVVLLLAVYYRVSGMIADLAVVFNIFFLLAIMAGLKATLTMPGIAGIILTVGISVDANVLIFERIREELRTGKTVRASIDAGYNRALLTIIDSHVTTLITAGALFLFGSGPIKGFAVSLFWGVLISLYTAVVITKTVFDVRKSYKTLSI